MTASADLSLVEFPASDPAEVAAAQHFYTRAFGWEFAFYGPEYADTASAGTTVGFNAVPDEHRAATPLAVLHTDDLEAAREAVVEAGGRIRHEPYDFPGGRRFHFLDPAGNELAIWSEA